MKISVKSGGGGMSRSASSPAGGLLHNMNVARLVKPAVKANSAVGPKMLGLKSTTTLKPSLSASDIDKGQSDDLHLFCCPLINRV